MLVLPVLVAALSAVVWGSGDFCGGKASQRSNALAVTVLSQVAGLPVLVGCVAIFGGEPTLAALGWGLLAGVAGFAGIVLLYRGLSRGAMAVFAPVTAVTGAVVPLVFGLFSQDLPNPLAIAGAALAVVAVALVSLAGGPHSRITPGLIGLALAAGCCFGLFFVFLVPAGHSAGMWPLVGVRVGSVGAGLLVAALTRTPLRIRRASVGWAVVAGSFDIGANALYLAAVQLGQLAVVAPIAALYPVSTVILAMLVDRERMRPIQLAGLGLAATALVLVAS